MRVMIVGQKFFGAEVLKLCLARGDDVVAVSAPRVDDRLAALATDAGVPLCHRQAPGRGMGAGWAGRDPVRPCPPVCHARGARQGPTGALGYHPSLLPRHRGRDAVVWAVHMRDQVTGGTAYWLDDGADTGDIAAQDWCWVKPGDTAEALWRRELAPMGLRLLSGVLTGLDAGEVPRTPQDPDMATWEPAYVAKRLAGSR